MSELTDYQHGYLQALLDWSYARKGRRVVGDGHYSHEQAVRRFLGAGFTVTYTTPETPVGVGGDLTVRAVSPADEAT